MLTLLTLTILFICFGLFIPARRRALIVAYLLNRYAPPTWRPPAWAWQYDFVWRKRGKRICAQCGIRREPYNRLVPWEGAYITRMQDGRVNRPMVHKRPPYLCRECLEELKGYEEVRIGEQGQVRFAKNGQKIYPRLGEGIRQWATTIE